jgi:hypothetical protein
VVRDDDMLLAGMVLNMVSLLHGEATVPPAAIGVVVVGSASGPGVTLDAGVDGDAGLEECRAVRDVLLGFGGALVALVRVDCDGVVSCGWANTCTIRCKYYQFMNSKCLSKSIVSLILLVCARLCTFSKCQASAKAIPPSVVSEHYICLCSRC